MNLNLGTVGRLVVSVLTLMTVVALLSLTIYAVSVAQVGLAVVGVMLTAAFGFFSYRDYLHYFKNKG